MPDSSTVDNLFKLGPWLLGILASVIGVAIRNEWKTRQVEKAVFDGDGDLRLRKTEDCSRCMAACREAIEKQISSQALEMEKVRLENREDIHEIHRKIDDLPGRIINLLKNSGG